MQITIDTDKIAQLVEDSGKIFLNPEAEQNLIELLEAQKMLEDALTEAKAKIEEEGLKINPNFKGIQADDIRIGYRYFGAEYRIDEAYADKLPEELVNKKVTYSVNNQELKNYVEMHKGLPLGIVANERKKTITISLKGDQNAEE